MISVAKPSCVGEKPQLRLEIGRYFDFLFTNSINEELLAFPCAMQRQKANTSRLDTKWMSEEENSATPTTIVFQSIYLSYRVRCEESQYSHGEWQTHTCSLARARGNLRTMKRYIYRTPFISSASPRRKMVPSFTTAASLPTLPLRSFYHAFTTCVPLLRPSNKSQQQPRLSVINTSINSIHITHSTYIYCSPIP